MEPQTLCDQKKTAQIQGLSTWQGIFCSDVGIERKTQEREPGGKKNITWQSRHLKAFQHSPFSLKKIF